MGRRSEGSLTSIVFVVMTIRTPVRAEGPPRDCVSETLAFGSTAEFVRSKPAHEVGFLILDVRLPELGGWDFQAELAAAKVNIPIIFLTGYAEIPMIVQAMKGGALEFLTKPFREQVWMPSVLRSLEIARDGLRTRYARCEPFSL